VIYRASNSIERTSVERIGYCKIGQMKNPIQLLYSHITIAKFICLTLLFSPLWGFWWFNINDDATMVWLLPALRLYSIISRLPVTIIYSSVCILAFVGFVITAFIRTAVVRAPLMLIMLIGWAFELSILDVNGVPSSQNLYWVLWQERAMALEALHSYAPYVIRNWAFVMILGSCCAHRPRGDSAFPEYSACCRWYRER
jgi:hypothetical protein